MSLVSNSLFNLGFIIMILGFAITFSAAIFLFRQARGGVKGGGIIMIGPFPIIFGSDTKIVKMFVIIAIFLMVIFFVMYLL